MKRKLSKVAIGLVALAVQLLPRQAIADAEECCLEVMGAKLCAKCSAGANGCTLVSLNPPTVICV